MDQPIFIAVDSGKHSIRVIGKRGESIVSLTSRVAEKSLWKTIKLS